MRIEPELPDHPKFLRFKKIVGEGAMEYLIRLFGHCQNNQRGEFWAGADADYVEMICRWDREPGVLSQALTQCGKPGFLELTHDGVIVHDWNEMNSQAVANWRKNPRGRGAKKQSGTNGEPTANPVLPLGQNGGANPTRQEPTANPVLNHMGNQSGTNGEPTALSLSLSSHSPSPEADDYDLARRLIGVLNDLTGAKFDPPLVELEHVVACLLDCRRDVTGIEKMLRRQAALWQSDPKSRQWLKPGTLFGPKFHDYYGQRDLPALPLTRAQLQDRVDKNPANRLSVYHRPDASPADKQQLRADRAALEAFA